MTGRPLIGSRSRLPLSASRRSVYRLPPKTISTSAYSDFSRRLERKPNTHAQSALASAMATRLPGADFGVEAAVVVRVFAAERVDGRQQSAHQRVGGDEQPAAEQRLFPVAAEEGRKADDERRQQMQRQLGRGGSASSASAATA